MKELKVWLKYTNNSFQQVLASRTSMIFLLTGKIIRVFLFLAFLFFLFNGAKGIGTYSRNQIIFFYLTFNLIDTLAQLFFREVYRFRALIVSGNFDFTLLKPVSPLLRVLLGGADVMDLIMLFLLIGACLVFSLNNFSVTPLNFLIFILLLLNGLIVAAAFHIFVLGIGIITTSVDHLIMIYRDMTSMLRIPVDLYMEPIRFILTFLLPLGIMITFPTKALLGILSINLIIISLVFGVVSLFLSLIFWNFSVKKYSSASS